jgi:uncharacterized repeat protein (TIGR01451 family)
MMLPRRRAALLLTILTSAVVLSAAPAEAAPINPTISGFSPKQGPVGSQVQIFGNDFQGAQDVKFNGASAPGFSVVSQQEIDATVPREATTGRIQVLRGPDTATSSSNFTVVVVDADLLISMSESVDPVVANSPLTYTLTVHNAGPSDAAFAVLDDTLPAEVIFSSANSLGTYDAGTGHVTWDLGTVPKGTNVTRSLIVEPIHPEAPMSNSATVSSWANDPTTPNTVTTDTTVVPEPGVHYFSVRDGGITPAFHHVAMGETVQWDFYGPGAHRITDSHGLGLIDTGLRSPIDIFRFTFNQSAEIRTKDLDTFPMNTNKIVVPVQTSPASGTKSTSFQVTWALAPPPSGLGVDVQVKRPGGVWKPWRRFQDTLLSATYVPDAGPGTYYFRTRIRNALNTARSRFGPPVPITVTG